MSATSQFLTKEKGRKTAAVLPREDSAKRLEDLDDLSVMAERRGEATMPQAEFKQGLTRNGLSH